MNERIEHFYLSTGNSVIAMDRLSGAELWRAEMLGPKGLWGRQGRLAVQTLLAHGKELYVVTNRDLRCLDGLTGSLLWKKDIQITGLVINGLVQLSIAGAEPAVPQAAAGGAAQATQQAQQDAQLRASGAQALLSASVIANN